MHRSFLSIALSNAVSTIIILALPAVAAAQIPTRTPEWLEPAYSYDAPFFGAETLSAQVPTPRSILGFDIGDRPVTHAEILKCLDAWRGHPRMKRFSMGHSHEMRELVYVAVSAPKNIEKLDSIRESIGRLADPRKLGDSDAAALIRDTPGVAWLAYSIHGDELSGSDAAVATLYRLLASESKDNLDLLDSAVLLIDPLQNPDGRDRFIRMCDEAAGYTPNLDPAAVQHAGRWPRGRTNHYYCDMNRDWIYAVHPETRARQRAILSWNPQLLIDGHEMGHDSSFLFNPAREPFNPGLSPLIRKWWQVFADAGGAAFDQHGWSYYTREWADFWYPGYTDGWATLNGTVGILYEQARTGGRPIRLATGKILTYREAVHHQYVCTLAHLETFRKHRADLLKDFLAQKQAGIKGDPSQLQTFLLEPDRNRSRADAFIELIRNQGVEIGVAQQSFSAAGLTGTLGQSVDSREFPAGTFVIQRKQPRAPLVAALLDFDARMDKAFLDSERVELETRRVSRLYDITAWSPPMAYGLDAYWSKAAVTPSVAPLAASTAASASRPASLPARPYAWVIDGADDGVMRAAAHLLQAGVRVRVAEKEFRCDGRLVSRGSLLIRRHENDSGIAEKVTAARTAAGVELLAASTARSPDETPDLGGEHMFLLQPPRVALLGDGGGDLTTYGAIWHLLDHEIGLATSLYDAEGRGLDSRRFNVMILTDPRVLRARADELGAWVRAGGTLIAIGGAASALADEKHKLSEVRRRGDVLKSLEEYASAASVERGAGRNPVDVDKLFGEPAEVVPPGQPTSRPETKLTDEALEDWRKLFSPTGTIVRGELNPRHWLTFGCPEEMPLFVEGSTVLLSKSPVETPVRFSESRRLRLSGLLWPEAAQRLADSAYLTVERQGEGQVILFAQDPNFRGAWHGTRRLLLNAILFGPGCGASVPAP